MFRDNFHPEEFVIPTITICGGIPPAMKCSIILRRQQLLCRGWDIIARDSNGCWVSASIKDMPTDDTSSFNGDGLVDGA